MVWRGLDLENPGQAMVGSNSPHTTRWKTNGGEVVAGSFVLPAFEVICCAVCWDFKCW